MPTSPAPCSMPTAPRSGAGRACPPAPRSTRAILTCGASGGHLVLEGVLHRRRAGGDAPVAEDRREDDEWAAMAYVWRDGQAIAAPDGAELAEHTVPSSAQCFAATAAGRAACSASRRSSCQREVRRELGSRGAREGRSSQRSTDSRLLNPGERRGAGGAGVPARQLLALSQQRAPRERGAALL